MPTLQTFVKWLRGRSVLVLTDSAVVCCYLNRQGGRFATLSRVAERVLHWASMERIRAQQRGPVATLIDMRHFKNIRLAAGNFPLSYPCQILVSTHCHQSTLPTGHEDTPQS